ncbi:AbfB domain-containing protein [Streptomyces sp. RB6PN25]|uniref:AbfB domain-containing protein n=1 Tax=Streptomyces humicola TaxID=2953240 RepID=A0ABT1Q5A1_9ACTN|nr:AbfB domain-containing protein [Streptomyces humicola]MCQ4085099.1 AbfB domain-containing protein [Streptomyces humicola]
MQTEGVSAGVTAAAATHGAGWRTKTGYGAASSRHSETTSRCLHRWGTNGQGNSFQSYNYPSTYIRHYDYDVYIAGDGGSNAWDSATSWTDDVSWVVSAPWAP